jgi:hypothetical protein
MMFIFQYHSLVSGNIFNFLDRPPIGHLDPQLLQLAFHCLVESHVSHEECVMHFAEP